MTSEAPPLPKPRTKSRTVQCGNCNAPPVPDPGSRFYRCKACGDLMRLRDERGEPCTPVLHRLHVRKA